MRSAEEGGDSAAASCQRLKLFCQPLLLRVPGKGGSRKSKLTVKSFSVDYIDICMVTSDQIKLIKAGDRQVEIG